MTTELNLKDYLYLCWLLEKLCNCDVTLYFKTKDGKYYLVYETKE